MRTKGLFIVLEGLDGSGKTTQRGMIESYLRERYPLIVTREPGGTHMAEAIRGVVLDDWEETVSGRTEAMLIYAARHQHVENVIKPYLDKGYIILCDRFTASSYSYQSVGRGIPMDEILSLEKFAIGDFKPDLTFIFDIDPEIAAKRLAMRNEAANRMDKQSLDFYTKTREMYKKMTSDDPSTNILIDANQASEVVFDNCKSALDKYIQTYIEQGKIGNKV